MRDMSLSLSLSLYMYICKYIYILRILEYNTFVHIYMYIREGYTRRLIRRYG